jgi:hypothetical protein
MCSGGELLADFTAGTDEAPDVPGRVRECLTETVDGKWVVWAHKLARTAGDRYQPLTGGGTYPADATASCRAYRGHEAPQPSCTCGFHAVSVPGVRSGAGDAVETLLEMISPGYAWHIRMGGGHPKRFGMTALEVALSGRVLAFDWMGGGVLFRAARQTVLRAVHEPPKRPDLDDPGGVLAHALSGRPKGAGPRRLRLPSEPPAAVDILDDAGFCLPPSISAATREARVAAPC